MPDITLYFLQASRSIRTAWQLEELGLDYKVEFADREQNKAPQAFKDSSGDALGKFPVLKDGDLIIAESGAIAEYLCEQYDTSSHLLPKDPQTRILCRRWVHAAEATFALHGLAILYARWFSQSPEAGEAAASKMSFNVINDMNFLESELGKSKGGFLCGDRVTVADCMMMFSAQFILKRELGTEGKRWEGVEKWIERCEGTESYKRAVKKTGYRL